MLFYARATLSIPNLGARQAMAVPVVVQSNVGRDQFMTADAVGFVEVLGGSRHSAHHVGDGQNKLHVIHVHAMPDAA
jgi:hypothetical protein